MINYNVTRYNICSCYNHNSRLPAPSARSNSRVAKSTTGRPLQRMSTV